MAFDPLDTLTNLTRSALDDHLNTDMLTKHTSAYAKLMMDPITQAGEALTGTTLWREHQGRWVTSGVAQYGREIIDPYTSLRLEWVRYIKSMTVDGFQYERNTGQDLESSLSSGGMGNFSVGGARTLISMHKNELLGIRNEIIRDINKSIYFGGNTGDPQNRGFLGFQQIMAQNETYGQIEYDQLGQHDWESTLLASTDGVTDARPFRWNPLFKDLNGEALSLHGELESAMIDLNHGGSAITPMGITNNYWMFCHQRLYADMLRSETLRNQLRRDIGTGGPGGNPDIGGVTAPLVWDSYNLSIFPDTDCPVDEVYIINPKCVKFAQPNSDQTFMRKWRLGSEQDTIMIPFYKTCQMWCDDRSQTCRLFNIGTSTNDSNGPRVTP